MRIAVAFGLIALGAVATSRQLTPVEYAMVRVGRVTYHTVSVDLKSEAVLPAVLHSPRLTPLRDLLGDEPPAVAITGTFFHPTSAYPVGDVVVEGEFRAHGSRGTVLGVTWLGEVEIFDTPFQQTVDLSRFRSALRGTVRLLRDGVVAADPRGQRFRDPRLWSRAPRCAVGTTGDGRVLFVATQAPVLLSEIGRAMIGMGVRDAVNLDGGSSACLVYRGQTKVRPTRKLSNLFVVYEQSPFLLPAAR